MGKILIYGMQSGLGGVERYVLNLSAFLENPQQHYGYIILGDHTAFEEELKFYGVDYFFLTHKNESLIKNIVESNRLLKKLRYNYDTIYFNTSGLYYPIPYLFAKKYNYRIILHSHSIDSKHLKSVIHNINRCWINKIISKRFACSIPAAQWMFGNQACTAQMIPNAIDLEKFRFRKEVRNQRRSELNILDNNTIVLGNIGRLSYVKNQKFLLEIFREYKKKQTNIKLLMVGDGEEEAALKKLTDQYQITDDVIFYGRSDSAEELMCAMDCIVMPSIVEGFPVTLVEGQASGLPCIVSTAITDEVNLSGKVEFISLNEDAKTWVEHILNTDMQRYDCMETLRKKGYEVHELAKTIYELIQEER